MNKTTVEKKFLLLSFLLIGLFTTGCSIEQRSVPLDCNYRALVIIKNSSEAHSREKLKQCGYADVHVSGIWTRGFEKSQFTADGTSNEKWWVTWFDDSRLDALTTQEYDERFTVAKVCLTGYLSPPGSFGHLGGYNREIIITNFNQISGLDTKAK